MVTNVNQRVGPPEGRAVHIFNDDGPPKTPPACATHRDAGPSRDAI